MKMSPALPANWSCDFKVNVMLLIFRDVEKSLIFWLLFFGHQMGFGAGVEG